MSIYFPLVNGRGLFVPITCTWSPAIAINKQLVLYRQRDGESEHVVVWQVEGSLQPGNVSTEGNASVDRDYSKFRERHPTDFSKQLKVNLLDADDEDEGVYWCSLNVTPGNMHVTDKRQLAVVGKMTRVINKCIIFCILLKVAHLPGLYECTITTIVFLTNMSVNLKRIV